jgi:Protein of unknown function with PCYCGC motif
MSKSGRFKNKAPRRKKKARIGQLVLAVIVVAGLASAWMLISREPAPDSTASQSEPGAPASLQPEPGLEDRMILPATPENPRPATLNPAAFASDPEIQAAYQAAKDVPEVLEHLACYCGCFGNAGHRNNLDCFKDSHGTGCSLCRAIALEGERQAKLGTPIPQIKRIVDERWAPRIH